MRHACLATKEFSDDTFDRSASEDGEGMTSVGCDDTVVWCDTSLESDRNGFLEKPNDKVSAMEKYKEIEGDIHLANSQMTEATNEFLFVQCICCHLHSPHCVHIFVHGQQSIFCHLHLEPWNLCAVGLKRVFV